MKNLCFVCLACLLLLCGCGKSVIWVEVGTSVFDLEKAAEENLVVPTFDASIFHVTLDPSITPLTSLDEETVLCRKETGVGQAALLAVTLDGEETYLQEEVDPTTLAVSANSSVATAAYQDGRLEWACSSIDGTAKCRRWTRFMRLTKSAFLVFPAASTPEAQWRQSPGTRQSPVRTGPYGS